MNVVGRGLIVDFSISHADARGPLETWFLEAQAAAWQKPQDIKDKYSSASFLKGNQVIFNIKGNDYRLATKVAYPVQTVLITWIGTHAEYSKRKFL